MALCLTKHVVHVVVCGAKYNAWTTPRKLGEKSGSRSWTVCEKPGPGPFHFGLCSPRHLYLLCFLCFCWVCGRADQLPTPCSRRKKCPPPYFPHLYIRWPKWDRGRFYQKIVGLAVAVGVSIQPYTSPAALVRLPPPLPPRNPNTIHTTITFPHRPRVYHSYIISKSSSVPYITR